MGKIFFSLPRPQWERVGVRVILGCLWLITGLCFGQEGLLKAEAKPSLMYGNGFHNQPLTVLKNSQLQPLSFYASYKGPSFNSFITNALIMQAENETLQPKTSFWKQAGIYGLEYIGATVGNFPVCLLAFYDAGQTERYRIVYNSAILNSVSGGTTTWLTGKILGQKGSWWGGAVGSGVGAVIGVFLFNTCPLKDGWILLGYGYFILPPLGAVIGYNL